ncbi:LytR C-terminal domain-containing protein [Bifidobacterium sp. 82T10]|uniref:LytR C-terminal domain-containing protein n=1 Tax=Bifidobacterium miconis TaxID=2834435 RepID=A0ABS6WFF4_9BIFI|nr:LytR C-terminal domain-containing protein [Bifidobacterium miconis]MBW3092791.1 LytR C-terminal domain-containing protein [Bifidobacterium miconis]
MSELYDERQARKVYMRRRQVKVFSVTIVLLAAALVVALMFYFHLFGLGVAKTAAVQPNYGVTAPCVPNGSDGKASKYPANNTITVQVVNGTDHLGLAGAVTDAMENRGFVMQDAGTLTKQKDGKEVLDKDGNPIVNSDVQRTIIYFGKNAIAQAYTVNANFTDAVMVMDDRSDMLITVVIGATFNDVSAKDSVPDTGDTIERLSGCRDAVKLVRLPKAVIHKAVEPSQAAATTQQ